MSKIDSRRMRALTRLHVRIRTTYGENPNIPKHEYEEWRGLIANIFEVPQCTVFIDSGYDDPEHPRKVTNPLYPTNQVYIGGSPVTSYLVDDAGVLQKSDIRWHR